MKIRLAWFCLLILLFSFLPASLSASLLKLRPDPSWPVETKATPGKAPAPVKLRFVETMPVDGQRWLNGGVDVRYSGQGELTLQAELIPVGASKSVAGESIPMKGNTAARISVDLLSAGEANVILRVRLLDGGHVVASDEVLLRHRPIHVLPSGTRIPVKLDQAEVFRPGKTGVTFGVPFPAGKLWRPERLSLVTASGRPVPAQIEPVATWFPGGSIKWVRVDALVQPAEGLFVLVGKERNPAPAGLSVKPLGEDKVEVINGAARYLVSSDLSPIRSIAVGGKEMITAEGARGLYVVDLEGRIGQASSRGATLKVESAGPLAVCIRLEGPYLTENGEELAQHVTRVEIFAGQPEAKITHSLILSRSTREIGFREVGLDLRLAGARASVADFGTASDDWRKHQSVAFPNDAAVASLAQLEHYFYRKGQNRFFVTLETSGGGGQPVATGEEAGDWAAIRNREGGMLVSVRHLAKLHPKELIATPHGMTVLLFSPSGGETLDFDLATRAERANFKELLARTRGGPEELVKKIVAHHSDALGWSKTHELIVSPLIAAWQEVTDYAQPAARLAFPVEALADPAWLATTEAMGPLHPYDPERFAELEKGVEDYVENWRTFGEKLGQFGILDYGAGPQFIKSFNPPELTWRRYRNSYNMRSDLWAVYARRGQRKIRAFAENSSRYFGDMFMVHVDGPPQKGPGKVKGFFGGGIGRDTGLGESPSNMPVPWSANANEGINGTADLNMFLYDYFLTGRRRSRDLVENYAKAVEPLLREGGLEKAFRRQRLFFCAVQAYSLDWSESLGEQIYRNIPVLYDADGGVKIANSWNYAPTYKTNSDLRAILSNWEILRDPRLLEMARGVADYWNYTFSQSAFAYGNNTGERVAFLYRQTGDVAQGEIAMLALRDLLWEFQADTRRGRYVPAMTEFSLRGFAAAQTVAVETGAWEKSPVSFSGLRTVSGGVDWYVRRGGHRKAQFDYAGGWGAGAPGVPELEVRPVDPKSGYTHDVNRITSLVTGGATVEIAKDAQDCTYRISAAKPGRHLLLADDLYPLVVRPSGYWQPDPNQSPPLPIWFSVPEGSDKARIYLEEAGLLTQPDGSPLRNGEAVSGWVDLPKAGLWKLMIPKSGLIRGEGFPQFFSFGDPQFHFLPPVKETPEREDGPSVEIPEEAVMVASGDRKGIVLQVAGQVKPMTEGTLEFWFRPRVSSVELKKIVSLITLYNAEGDPMTINLAPGGPQQELSTHHLAVRIPIYDQVKKRDSGWRGQSTAFFEAGQWYHIALSWGQISRFHNGESVFGGRIFVNGQRGRGGSTSPILGAYTRFIPTRLELGAGLPCDIADVRLSDTHRYLSSFTPPLHGVLKTADRHTITLRKR